MSEELPDPKTFYFESVPAQFNATLREQERLVETAGRVLEGMRNVSTTIAVIVSGDGGGTFFLNIEKGEMTASDNAAQQPFLTMIQDRSSFERLTKEAGGSALGLLGGLAGMAGEMKLTRGRLDNLGGVKGSVLFELTGEHGFTLTTHFGPDPVPDEPNATIRVEGEAYQALRSGELDPQSAFLGGKIQVEGDMQMAMQLALAALSPE